MQRYPDPYNLSPRMAGDWSAEITGPGQNTAQPQYATMPGGQRMPMGDLPGMRTDLPEEVIQNPLSVEEAHKGSIKEMLGRNQGAYVVATFLMGTQGTVSWEGILYDVGNNFITIYQPGRERYIVTDIYALKYIEFYDTRRRAQCEEMLNETGGEWQPK